MNYLDILNPMSKTSLSKNIYDAPWFPREALRKAENVMYEGRKHLGKAGVLSKSSIFDDAIQNIKNIPALQILLKIYPHLKTRWR